MITCPECDHDQAVADKLQPSEVIECGECRTELEVLTVDPVTVGVAPEVEEDWGE